MRILVTGGSGFIGTHFVDKAIENHEVLNLDVKEPKVASQRGIWIPCDIQDRAGLKDAFASFRPEAVVHLAARTDTDSDVIQEYSANTEGTKCVLDTIADVGSVCRFVLTSTQFVFQAEGYPTSDEDYRPHTVYGESKVIAEKILRDSGLKCHWTIVRPTNVWGPWHPRYPQEFWRVLGRGLYFHPRQREPVIRSYGYVKNVVAQISSILTLNADVVDRKTFYVGDSPIDLLDWVNEFSSAQIGRKVVEVPRSVLGCIAKVGDILGMAGFNFPLSSSRLRSMTISNPVPMAKTFELIGHGPYTMEEGVKETVNWLRKYHPSLVRR